MRKMAITAASFSAGIFAANYLLPHAWLPYLAIPMLLLALLLFLLHCRWLLGIQLGLLGLACALLFFSCYSEKTHGQVSRLVGREKTVQAVLLDYPQLYKEYCSVRVRVDTQGIPDCQAILYDDSMDLTEALPGQRIEVNASLRAADSRYGEDYDGYYSKGIFLILNTRSAPRFLERKTGFSVLPSIIKRAVSTKIDQLFPPDTTAFMRAVMLGDKDRLYEDPALYLALSRAGLMHVAAVSGMHLVFLASFIQLLLGKSRNSSLIAIPILWIFVLITGSSPSAVRAAFMQTVLLLAPVLRRENDPVTSLSAVLALVLLNNPYAAASVSLQLSFAAVCGILCFSGWMTEVISGLIPSPRIRQLLQKPIGIIAVSLSVMVFTLPLMAVHFRTVSILSPISNLVALWAASLCFCGGFLSCAAGWAFSAAGVFCAWLISFFAQYFMFVSQLISAIPFATVYLETPFHWCWFGATVFCIVLALFMRISGWIKLLFPIAISCLILSEANFFAHRHYCGGEGTIAVLDVGQGQSIAACRDEAAVVVDCGAIGALGNSGTKMGAYLKSRGVKRLDALVLTHLHRDHADGAAMLMEMLPVETVFLPSDPMDDEGYLLQILESAQRHGTRIEYVSQDQSHNYGAVQLALYQPSEKGDANERCLMGTLTLGGFDLLITADAPMAAENELTERCDLSHVDAFIVGHHGSRYSTGKALLKTLKADTAIISVGYNRFGHPTWETLARLSAYDYRILRTDLNGTIEIRP